MKIIVIVIGVHTVGAFSFVMLHYAIAHARVSLVNALQGVQYVFLLLMVYFLAKKFPQLIQEKISKSQIWQRIGAVFLICFGLLILALSSRG